MDASREGQAAQIERAEQAAVTGFPEEGDAATDELPVLVRACLDELMDALIAINEQGRETVRLREGTREILKRLRAA